jgi:hypothetical protein
MSMNLGECRTISSAASRGIRSQRASNVKGRGRYFQGDNFQGDFGAGAYSYKYPTGFPSVRSGRMSFRVMI